MNYQIVTTVSMGQEFEHVIISHEDGSFESFPADKDNPKYQQFLKDTKKK